MKTFTINESGEVREVSPLMRGLSHPEVEAATKTEATALLLRRLKAIANFSARLEIRDGAFLMLTHNGENIVAESGTLERANNPLCVSHHNSMHSALKDSSFAYYASEEYRKACA